MGDSRGRRRRPGRCSFGRPPASSGRREALGDPAGGELSAIRSDNQWSPAGAVLLGGRVAIGGVQLEIGGRFSSYQTTETTQGAPLQVMDLPLRPCPWADEFPYDHLLVSGYASAHELAAWPNPFERTGGLPNRSGNRWPAQLRWGRSRLAVHPESGAWAESGISPSVPEQRGISARRASRLGVVVNLVKSSAEPHFRSPTHGDEAASASTRSGPTGMR